MNSESESESYPKLRALMATADEATLQRMMASKSRAVNRAVDAGFDPRVVHLEAQLELIDAELQKRRAEHERASPPAERTLYPTRRVKMQCTVEPFMARIQRACPFRLERMAQGLKLKLGNATDRGNASQAAALASRLEMVKTELASRRREAGDGSLAARGKQRRIQRLHIKIEKRPASTEGHKAPLRIQLAGLNKLPFFRMHRIVREVPTPEETPKLCGEELTTAVAARVAADENVPCVWAEQLLIERAEAARELEKVRKRLTAAQDKLAAAQSQTKPKPRATSKPGRRLPRRLFDAPLMMWAGPDRTLV